MAAAGLVVEKNMDIMFYEVFAEERKALKKFFPGEIKTEFCSQTIQECPDAPSPAKVLSIRTQSIIPLSWAPQIRGIFTRSSGYDHLVEYCRRTKRNIPCGYLEDYCSRAVAEHAILMILALLRKMKKQLEQFDSFCRDNLTGKEVCGRNVLVVGVGRIGLQIAQLAQGMSMNVKGVDISPNKTGVEYVSLPEGIPWADVIVCAVPLTAGTEGMLAYPLLKQAKKGAIFINISRGEISPVEDLKNLLDEGILGGLSLDVYPLEGTLAQFMRGESKVFSSSIKTILELKGRENVLFSPHNAFNSEESLERKAKQSADSLSYFLLKNIFPHPVPCG